MSEPSAEQQAAVEQAEKGVLAILRKLEEAGLEVEDIQLFYRAERRLASVEIAVERWR